jgi:hypothetical protein
MFGFEARFSRTKLKFCGFFDIIVGHDPHQTKKPDLDPHQSGSATKRKPDLDPNKKERPEYTLDNSHSCHLIGLKV